MDDKDDGNCNKINISKNMANNKIKINIKKKKEMNIALVLPAYNLEQHIQHSLLNIKKGIELFPQYEFTLFPVEIKKCTDVYELYSYSYRNPVNIGLVETLKQTYSAVIDFSSFDYVLKTDMDKDFDQSIVMQTMIPYANKADVVAGVRWRHFTEKENAFEYKRRCDITRILKQELGLQGLDPPSVGSQFYRVKALKEILVHDMVANYDNRWGLDFLISVVAAKLTKSNFKVVNIEEGKYDAERRKPGKVKAQYDAYLEIVGDLVGKRAGEISELYGCGV